MYKINELKCECELTFAPQYININTRGDKTSNLFLKYQNIGIKERKLEQF